jgi:head-tail adaptor
MSDAIGAMRARVTLQSPAGVSDEIGGAAISWNDEGAAWAEVEASGAGESVAHDRALGVATYKMGLHRRPDVRVGWRVLWGERVLRVVGVADDGDPRMIMSCEEEAP